MIPYEFEYYKPHSLQEAFELYARLQLENKKPLYFCGGTEIITMARLSLIDTNAVIDIKGIPECCVLESKGEQVTIGSTIPLAKLEEETVFPLLSRVCNRIADHTSRCKITLGGNICGKIFYREAVLPLLVADSELVIAGKDGLRKVSIHEVFHRQIQLLPGEFVVQAVIPKSYTEMPYMTEKRTKIDRIDYPVVTVAALKNGDTMRFSFSGLCPFPFRSQKVEEALNNRSLKPIDRTSLALNAISDPILDDINGSAEYRKFVVRNLLLDAITTLEGDCK